jgi:hypothetical protein
LTGSYELVFEGGKRYAFMVGFDEPAGNRGIGLAITIEVHTREAAEFVSDANVVPIDCPTVCVDPSSCLSGNS